MNAFCKRSITCVRNQSSWHWWAATGLLCVWHSLDHLLIDDTQLTNGQHACVLVFAPMAVIFEHTLWLSICFLCRSILNDFMLYITLDAENHRLRVKIAAKQSTTATANVNVSVVPRWPFIEILHGESPYINYGCPYTRHCLCPHTWALTEHTRTNIQSVHVYMLFMLLGRFLRNGPDFRQHQLFRLTGPAAAELG